MPRSDPRCWPARRALLAAGLATGLVGWAGLATLPAQAQPRQASTDAPAAPAGLALPAEVAQALPGASLRGATRFRVWGFEVYDARLWTLPGFVAERFDSQPLALELGYLRNFEARDIAERSLKEMRRSADISAEQAQRWLAEMQRVFPDVKKGERLLGVHRPGEAAAFWFNGQPRGDIRDAEFARLFFGIWLSPRTSEPALRQALLGAAP